MPWSKALDHLVQQIPVMPGEEGEHHVEARRADALVMLASTQVATDQDPDLGCWFLLKLKGSVRR